MIEDKLKELGLSDKEVAVYTAVVAAGKASPARVAKATGIKRPTVYAVGEDLLRLGLIEADTTGATMFYFPASADSLKRSVEKEKQKLKSKETLLESLAKEVEAMPRSKSYAVPRIQFIEHEENVLEFLHKQTDVWNQSMLKTEPTYWGFQDDDLVSHEPYRNWIKWQWDHTPEAIDLKLLSNDTDIEARMKKENYPRRNIKFWKGAINFTATQYIVGDYSVLIQTKQKPHYLVQMYDPVYCANMRELFKNLWKEV
jgi:sugar-specific transcriptional regulator TrmB